MQISEGIHFVKPSVAFRVPVEIISPAIATANNGAAPYPSSSPGMGAMHTALGNGLAAFLNGEKNGATALADIEAAYIITATESGLM